MRAARAKGKVSRAGQACNEGKAGKVDKAGKSRGTGTAEWNKDQPRAEDGKWGKGGPGGGKDSKDNKDKEVKGYDAKKDHEKALQRDKRKYEREMKRSGREVPGDPAPESKGSVKKRVNTIMREGLHITGTPKFTKENVETWKAETWASGQAQIEHHSAQYGMAPEGSEEKDIHLEQQNNETTMQDTKLQIISRGEERANAKSAEEKATIDTELEKLADAYEKADKATAENNRRLIKISDEQSKSEASAARALRKRQAVTAMSQSLSAVGSALAAWHSNRIAKVG